jgi:predicted RecB family nuclease
MVERLLTPSKITAWLECAHFLSLRNQADSGALVIQPTPMGSLAELLVEKGSTHERDCLADLENEGRSVYQVPGRNPNETFSQWVARVAGTLEKEYDVIYQMPFVHDGIRGIADFLIRVDASEGYATYEPIDAKLTRVEGKPGHVLQLCFYAEAIAALTGVAPKEMHLWLGSGERESLAVDQYIPYWRRLRRQLTVLLNQDQLTIETTPEPCMHCEVCEFSGRCESEWREEDSLVYVANIRPPERDALGVAGVRTVAELASRRSPVPDVHQDNLQRLVGQASLQLASREHPETPPEFAIIDEGDDPVYGHGFSLMPAPDDGDVFFDFEGHPFWTARHDLFFLAGLYLRSGSGEWTYDPRWAHDLEQQRVMIKALVEFFAARRQQFPSMHVYHYNHTERSSLERLTRGTESEGLFTELVESGLFVDLFVVARNAVQVGTESYGLKHLERLTGFVRSGDIEGGAGAVVQYEEWMKTGRSRLLEDIARYNCEDVQATMALRDWLLDRRSPELEWREALLETVPYEMATDALVEGLKKFGEKSPEHLLGDLLTYWRRERSAYTTPKFAQAASDFGSLYGDRDFIANLDFEGFDETTSKGGKVSKYANFSWPEQDVDATSFKRQSSVLYTGVGVEHGYGYLSELDVHARQCKMLWHEYHEEAGGLPRVVTLDDYVRPEPKPGVLFHLAEQILSPAPNDPPISVSLALLRRDTPRFVDGFGPSDGRFNDDLASTLKWVGHLDNSYVALQGPPGTGKTYSGAHIIYELICAGQRVGITAMSHAAIDNLLHATYEVFKEHNNLDALHAIRQTHKSQGLKLDGVRYNPKREDFESTSYNLVAGSTWLWSRQGLGAYPVDVLVVDEAGQLALADCVAAANAARNLILLGDPLQLAQVSQAEHPDGSGASVLEHVLGGHATISDEQGVFISETRRMHPDVCSFISNQIYEGRLTSHASCAQQTTQFGTGLRWLRAEHVGRSTESSEESKIVGAQILSMLGTEWTNQKGESAPLVASDFMVVAPYNDQVNLLRREFDRTPGLAGVKAGTVDKFQGREAPVVFFTMTTSSSEDMPRGPEFLFSRNRLNVAVSRARCLAYLVCTEELLNSRARTIEEMRLIGTLSSFVEYAETKDEN